MGNLKEVQAVLSFHRQISERNKQGDDHWPLDRGNASRYFDSHPDWQDKIGNHVCKLAENNEAFVHLDICGRGSISSADKSYCFSLKTPERSKITAAENQIFFDGDLWNAVDFAKFLALVKSGGSPPFLVTFEPHAGLQNYGAEMKVEGISQPRYRAITYQCLAKRLRQIIEILKPGGYIYIQRPFQHDSITWGDWYFKRPLNQHWLFVNLEKVIGPLNCTIADAHQTIDGEYFLIRKRKTPARKAKK